MLTYNQSYANNSKIKPRNTVLYPISSKQQTSNSNAQYRRLFETKFPVRQNQFCVKPHIPIIYGTQSNNQACDSRNLQRQNTLNISHNNYQQIFLINRVQQVPVYTNPTSPRSPREKLLHLQKKQCQSLNNSPTRQETSLKNQQVFTKTGQQITSSSLSPKKENNENYSKTSLIPFQSPQNKGKKTLVLDLDETLIHSTQIQPVHFDLNFNIYQANQKDEFFVCFRPGVQTFLKIMSQYYEIFIWTASVKEYADVIINELDPSNTLISHRLYRESCVKKGESTVKDLGQLNRNIKDVIIIDVISQFIVIFEFINFLFNKKQNLSSCFKMHQENGIQIEDFIDNLQDKELEKMTPFLKFICELKDVRDVFTWKVKFQNQSRFEYINMKNEVKIFIKNQLSNKYENPKENVPHFNSEIQQNTIQNQNSQNQQMNLTLINESRKKEDYVYRNRRSISNIENTTNNFLKQEDLQHIQSLEHSFGESQTIFNSDNGEKDSQFNPIFQEFTFSKIKIEESRVVEEQITQTTDRVLEKNNKSNKHEKTSFQLYDQNYQYKQNKNNSPEFNKTNQQQQNGYYHQLQPTVFKLIDQNNNNPSNRNTPSFERNGEFKENNKNQTNIYGNLSQNLQGLIQEQKNKQTQQSNNNSDSSQRFSESSSNSTQPSSSATPTRLNSTLQTQNTLQNENTRISFQNKQQYINLFQSDELVSSKNQEDLQTITESDKLVQQNQPLKNDNSEYNIYQSHSIPRFLQLPTQKIEKVQPIQIQKNEVQKIFTFEPAKVQCEQKQQQILNMVNNHNYKLNSQIGRQSLKQQNKEVPQIKKDPSLQSVSMESRRKTADNIYTAKSLNQQPQLEQNIQQLKSYPKIFQHNSNNQLNQNINQNINIPVMSQQISLSKTQTQQNQFIKAEQPFNKQEIPTKVNINKKVSFQDENINNISLQQIPQTQQIYQRRHASQHISNTQLQQYDQNNNLYVNPQYMKQPQINTYSNVLKLSNKRQSFDHSTPSTASNSYSKEWENTKEKYPQNKIQCFEEYAVSGQMGSNVIQQQKMYQPQIQKYNNNNNIVFQSYLQKIN